MISWTPADLDRYLAEDPGGEVVMLNLLRFAPDGGRERYTAYSQALAPLREVYGFEVLYAGDAGTPLVPSGQAWDAVALVRYPDRATFGAMVRDPAYADCEPLRTAALADSVLQPTVVFGSRS